VVTALRADAQEVEGITAANVDGQIRVVAVGHRILFLVPRTKGLAAAMRPIGELLALAARERIRVLELIHFTLGDFPARIISEILDVVLRDPASVHTCDAVFDIDW
jgi:hypothetical protein